MAKRQANGSDRARRVLAQEAARIIVEQGIEDYRAAKIKAAERLGMSTRGALPGNAEVEQAIGEHLALFGRESHLDLLRVLRRAALSAMELLAPSWRLRFTIKAGSVTLIFTSCERGVLSHSVSVNCPGTPASPCRL